MERLQDIIRLLSAAGGTPSTDGKATFVCYEEKNQLCMRTWTGSELSDKEWIATGVRSGTSAPIVNLDYKRVFVVDKNNLLKCFVDPLRNRVEADDEDADEDDDDALWEEDKELTGLNVCVHAQSQLAASYDRKTIFIFYQDPNGSPSAIKYSGKGWKPVNLPAANVLDGTPLATCNTSNAVYLFYISIDGTVRYMENSRGEWKDEFFSSAKIYGDAPKLTIAEDRPVFNRPRPLVFCFDNNVLSTIKWRGNSPETVGVLEGREFQPTSDQQYNKYYYWSAYPYYFVNKRNNRDRTHANRLQGFPMLNRLANQSAPMAIKRTSTTVGIEATNAQAIIPPLRLEPNDFNGSGIPLGTSFSPRIFTFFQPVNNIFGRIFRGRGNVDTTEEYAPESSRPADTDAAYTSLETGETETDVPHTNEIATNDIEAEEVDAEETKLNKITTGDVKTGEVKPYEVETGEIKPYEVETDEVETDEVETDEVETDEVETDEVETDEVETDEVETDEVETDETEMDGIEIDEAEMDEMETDETETDETETDETETETDVADSGETEFEETDSKETDVEEAEEEVINSEETQSNKAISGEAGPLETDSEETEREETESDETDSGDTETDASEMEEAETEEAQTKDVQTEEAQIEETEIEEAESEEPESEEIEPRQPETDKIKAFEDKSLRPDENITSSREPQVPVVETPIMETPIVEVPVVEVPIVETPIMETPIVETSVVEKPMLEIPIVEIPIVETPIADTPIVETPIVEIPIVEMPIVETSVVETPMLEIPIVETPVLETPIIETPIIETPIIETPILERPIVETPIMETPIMETSVVETPIMETPIMETSIRETPVKETPVRETPVRETPVRETPVREIPVRETPVREMPIMDTIIRDTPFMKPAVDVFDFEESYPDESDLEESDLEGSDRAQSPALGKGKGIATSVSTDPSGISPREIRSGMNRFIEETDLSRFYSKDDPYLDTVVKKASRLPNDKKNLLRTDKDIQKMAILNLYQPVLYCDDSSSMKTGTREDGQKEMVQRVTRLSTRLVPKGFGTSLQFINHVRDLGDKLKCREVKEIMDTVVSRGNTKIGTNLERKILKPLIYDVIKSGRRLRRPLLISCITDGYPSGEDAEKFTETIIKCIQFLKEEGYSSAALRIQVSQIGNDRKADKFLKQLKRGIRNDPDLNEVLYCTAQRLDEQFEKLRDNEEELEGFLLNTLMMPIKGERAMSELNI